MLHRRLGVPPAELKVMEQYCINMAHTQRYLFDKMRKISAHPQHAKDLTPAGVRFLLRPQLYGGVFFFCLHPAVG